MNRTELLPDRPGIPPMAVLPEPETIDVEALRQGFEAGEYDLVCVLGPTASGKTRYAVSLARELSQRASGGRLRAAGLRAGTPLRGYPSHA